MSSELLQATLEAFERSAHKRGFEQGYLAGLRTAWAAAANNYSWESVQLAIQQLVDEAEGRDSTTCHEDETEEEEA